MLVALNCCRDGVVVRASILQSVNLSLIFVLSCTEDFKNDICSFLAQYSAQKKLCQEKAVKSPRCVLGH